MNTVPKLLALRTLLNILIDKETPGRSLVVYVLGPARRRPVREMVGCLVPSAETFPPILTWLGRFRHDICDLYRSHDIRGYEPFLECSTSFPWCLLVMDRLPTSARDFQWLCSRIVHPTKDRLSPSAVTLVSICPNRGRPESACHCMYECKVALPLWSLVTSLLGVRIIALY